MEPLISVIVVHYDSGNLLPRLIDTLEKQSFRAFELIIVDNGARKYPLPSFFPSFPYRVIGNGENIGFAAANNLAAEVATAPWLGLLNPDAYPEPNWLKNLFAATKNYPDCTMFGSLQRAGLDQKLLDGAGDVYFFAGFPGRGGYGNLYKPPFIEGEVFAPCAAAALLKRDVFIEFGGFDASLFCYCEESDYAFKTRAAGHYTMLIPDAVVWHLGSAVTGVSSDFAVYHGARNRLWVYVRHMPALLLFPTLPLHGFMLVLLLMKHLRNGTDRAYLRGLRDGIKELPRILAERRYWQKKRVVSFWHLASAFTWSPWVFFKLLPDIRIRFFAFKD